jgi:glycosyltransferase involved in cell wall biosynthesis
MDCQIGKDRRGVRVATEPVRVGVLSNEFFVPHLGRMGGFGWAASRVARLFGEDPELGYCVRAIAGSTCHRSAARAAEVHGVPFVPKTWNRLRDAWRLRAARLHVLLTIDYRRSYRWVFRALPETPTIVWVRDPRTPEDTRRVASLRLPDNEAVRPEGANAVDCTSLREEVARAARVGRPVRLVVTDPSLVAKIEATYGVSPGEVPVLPNPLPPAPREVRKTERPRVVFLGRLDPLKRPWLFVELARRFPQAEFMLLGQGHFSGPGSWTLRDPPDNLRIVGHADERLKMETLASAWVLVNTSLHEGLAVSMLEALACETPLLAMVDPGAVVSRFGVYAGDASGAGLDGMKALTDGLAWLLGDADWRTQRGREGRRWVEQHHGREPFLAAWAGLMRDWGMG